MCAQVVSVSLADVAPVVTAVGVAVAALQLRRQRDQARITFEESVTQRYRELMKELPVGALLGENPTEPPEQWPPEVLNAFIRYFYLSNEQIRLRDHKDVRLRTWEDWSNGIRWSFTTLPWFATAWDYVAERTRGSFKAYADFVARLDDAARSAASLAPAADPTTGGQADDA